MTATEASRNFSAVLDRVQAGEEIEIVRNGALVAVIRPLAVKKQWLTAAEFRELMRSLPPVDEDFIKDLDDIRQESGFPEDPWKKS
jgi:prevent-host-death family protein